MALTEGVVFTLTSGCYVAVRRILEDFSSYVGPTVLELTSNTVLFKECTKSHKPYLRRCPSATLVHEVIPTPLIVRFLLRIID